MTTLHTLTKIKARPKKRLGRGGGSGRGKTGGRGTKGQRARGRIPVTIGVFGTFLARRLPLYRGKFRNKPLPKRPLPVNVKYLNMLPPGTVVTIQTLTEKGIVDQELALAHGVKILGDGELKVALVVKLPCSKGAVKKIEASGGKVEK